MSVNYVDASGSSYYYHVSGFFFFSLIMLDVKLIRINAISRLYSVITKSIGSAREFPSIERRLSLALPRGENNQ